MTEAQGPVEGTDVLRMAIVEELAGWVEGNAPAAMKSVAVRDVMVDRVVSDLTDAFQMGSVAAKAAESREVISSVRILLRRPLDEAGLGLSLQSMVVAGRRGALRRLKAPEALARMADAASAAPEVSAMLERIAQGREAELAVPTGLTDLDRAINGGLPLGEMTLVGAGTGMGKTTFAMQTAYHAACEDLGLVFVCSPEMMSRDLWLRLAQREAGVTRRELKGWEPSKAQAAGDAVKLAYSRISSRTNMVLLDRADADIHAAIEAARIMHEARGPLRLVVLDYAQQLASEEEKSPRYIEVGRVGKEALQLAMDTGAAVMLTSQINVSKDKSGKVIETTYRESKTPEYKSTVALVLVARKGEGKVDIHVRKNRHGPSPLKLEFAYQADVFRMSDLGEVAAGPSEW